MRKKIVNNRIALSPEKPAEIGGSTNTGFIKCVAVFFMIMDHAGKLFFPSCLELRIFGRIAFPLFAWGIVAGCVFTRNAWKYALRILITGIVSQPLFMLTLRHPWTNAVWWNVTTWGTMNIFFTLALGVLSIACIRRKWYYSHIWGPCLAFLCALLLKVDYGWKGLMMILLLYAARKDRGALAMAFLAFCLFWGQGTSTVSSFFGLEINTSGLFNPILTPVLKLQFFAALALPFMLFTFTKRFRMPKWFTYGIYPAHLIVLYLIDRIL